MHSDLPFLPERMKISKLIRLVYNLYDKNNYVVYIRSLKQILNHELMLKKVRRLIQFNQNKAIAIDKRLYIKRKAKS